MSQSNSSPAAADAQSPAKTPGAATVPPPPPPVFKTKGTAVGSVVSKLGPILLVALVVAVAALFYLKSQDDTRRMLDDELATTIDLVPSKNPEAPKRIAAYEALLKEPKYAGHPYLTDLRVTLINEYFDVITAFDTAALTTAETKAGYTSRLKELVAQVVDRPTVDQRTLIAYYKRAQILEDEGDYAKAIADYELATKTALDPKVLVKPMASYLSFRIAQCYYWQFRQTTDAAKKEEFRVKGTSALTKVQDSKDVSQSMGRQIDFMRREMASPEALLKQIPNPEPRTPVSMEPKPAAPADGTVPAEGAAPAAPAQPTEGAAAPTAPTAPVAPVAPAAPANGGTAAPVGNGAAAPAGNGAVAPAGNGAPAPAGNGAPAPAGNGAPAPAGDNKPAGGWIP